MKRVTVESWFHTQCFATFYAPAYVETTRDAMQWLESEAYREESQLYYGSFRQKLARVRRALCGVKECRCGALVIDEDLDV